MHETLFLTHGITHFMKWATQFLPMSRNSRWILDKLPISGNGQVSCLFHEMGKIFAYFTKWAIHGLDVTYIEHTLYQHLLYKGMITFTKWYILSYVT